jgi:hypothetical protein
VQIITAVLLGIYFLFFLSQITTASFFTRLAHFQITLFDIVAIAFVFVTASVFSYRSRRYRSERLSRSEIFWIVIFSAVLMYLSFMSHLYDDNNKTPALTITVGFLATLGWIYTNYMNARHQTRAHGR